MPQPVPGTGANPDTTCSPLGSRLTSAPDSPAITRATGPKSRRLSPMRRTSGWKITRPRSSTSSNVCSPPGSSPSTFVNNVPSSDSRNVRIPVNAPANSFASSSTGTANRTTSSCVVGSASTPENTGRSVVSSCPSRARSG